MNLNTDSIGFTQGGWQGSNGVFHMTCEGDEVEGIRAEPRRVTTEQLFGDDNAIVIQHGNADYELKITRRKRLILTKKLSDDD